MLQTHEAVLPPFSVPTGAGSHFSFLNHLATLKVVGAEGSSMSVVEFQSPKGFGPPLHKHVDEDELFIVLDGRLVLRSGDEEIDAGPGSVSFLPHAVAHTFQVVSDEARFLNVTARTGGAHPRFDAMVTGLGLPIPDANLPDPGPIDPARVAEVCHANGIEILGPPPAPLEQGAGA